MRIREEIKKSAKWTFGGEILRKLITPLTGMMLARLLSPTEFGVVASIMVVTSFVDIFADAGFRKYFVQHNFRNEEEKRRCFNSALFIGGLTSVVFWLIICFFAEDISMILGAPHAKKGFILAGVGVFFNFVNGMQSAIFQREFQFKLLFRLRVMTAFLPLVITIP